ncbi:hypothetical protein OQA88_12864 [Cercophora sp. LCS_1]
MNSGPKLLSHLDQAPTPVLYQTLAELRTQESNSQTVRRIIQYLLQHRGEKPNVQLYEALAHANQDPSGSAAELSIILDEIHASNIQPTQTFYHAMLTALAIHPDYILRTKLLREMKARSIPLLPLSRSFAALGLLRDGQYEMALDALESMIRDVVDDLPPWVIDIFIFTLARRGFVDEATRLMGSRPATTADGETISPLTVWYFLLDEGSRQGSYKATKLIWQQLVEGSKELAPSDGMVMNVLHAAARNGDGDLGASAIRYLGERNKLGIQHYEALVDCYARGRDFENAFRVLGIMKNAGIEPGPGSTRGVYETLKGSNAAVKAALKALQALRDEKDGLEIPIAAAEVIMEAWCKRGKLDRALAYVYQHLDGFCPSGPSARTYEVLFDGLEKVGVADAAKWLQFLLEDMQMRFIRPSKGAYNAVVRCYIRLGHLDACFALMDQNPSLWLDKQTLLALVQRCLINQDPRAWGLIDKAKRRNLDVEAEVRDMLNAMEPMHDMWDEAAPSQGEALEPEREGACAYGASREETSCSIEDGDTAGDKDPEGILRAAGR